MIQILFIAAIFITSSLSIFANPESQKETPPPSVSTTAVEPPAVPANSAEKTAKTEPVKTETPAKAKREPPKALDQKGKIGKIDAATGTFVVEGKTFVLSNKSRVEIDGSLMSLSDLKEGDLVAVVYFAKSDGTNTATRVIKGSVHKKKKAKKSS